MAQIGKKRKAAVERVDRSRNYAPVEAVGLVKDVAYAKFDESVELHMRLGVDPRHADQQVRGVMALPHGTGRDVRILVFAEGDAARAAEAAGADHVGGDELAEKIRGGWLEFDSVIATQPMMRVVGRLGPVLGPRGLMPSPKTGTIIPAEDLPRVINESRLGRVEFRVDKTSNIHVPIGKASFGSDKLLQNLGALMEALIAAKPATLKGNYIHRVTLTSTMGPGVKTDIAAASALKADEVAA